MSKSSQPHNSNRARRISVWQHHPAEGPGRISRWAEQRSISLVRYEAWHGDIGIDDLGNALVVLGGPYSLLAPPQWLASELSQLKRVAALDVPILGICLGAQMLATVLGGNVVELGFQESGWTELTLDDGANLAVLNWHEQGFMPPKDSKLVASGKRWPQQMFINGDKYAGMQFHPEWDQETVTGLNQAFGASSPLIGVYDATRQAAVETWFFRFLDRWIQR